MASTQGAVINPGTQNVAAGTAPTFSQGRQGESLGSAIHPQFYQQASNGYVFSQAATPLGLAIPIYTATALAGGMPIWNPAGSGRNVVLICADFGWASGTADFAAVGLMTRSSMGSALGTAAPFSAFAATTPKNGLIGAGVASVAQSSNSGTVTLTTLGGVADWTRNLASINLEANTGTAHGTNTAHYEFNGSIIIPPGSACWFAATKASVALYATSVVWYEAPLLI